MSDDQDAAYLRGQIKALVRLWRAGHLEASTAMDHIEDIVEAAS